MVKVPLRCPFSKGPCRGCATYRGRHYYICYHRDRRDWGGRRIRRSEETKHTPSAVKKGE